MTNKRQEFYKTEDIIAEFKQYLKDSDKFDIVTVVGEGEPTLAANLGELVVALKALTDKPVAVITMVRCFLIHKSEKNYVMLIWYCHPWMLIIRKFPRRSTDLMERSDLKKNLKVSKKVYAYV